MFKVCASDNKLIKKYRRLYQFLNGSSVKYNLAEYHKILCEIKKLETKFKNKTNYQLKQFSKELSIQVKQGEFLDELLIEAYALVREVIWRVSKLTPFDVQIIGGIVMHHGNIVEMQTGEGKTLTAVFPAYLNGLMGRGVHILTFNDYLARRDANWMGPIFQFLGLKVSCVQEGMSIVERRNAYSADITYITAKEAGFDFLRDNLCSENKDIVHRTLNLAIIDEADSILIDEARNPLIIAGVTNVQHPDTYYIAKIVKSLEYGIDFEFDEYFRNINLTDSGSKHIEKLLDLDNLYDANNINLLIQLNSAIHAEFLLHRDVDYIVRNGKIEIVDEFTGRIANNRRWPDGLQSALETKENVVIQSQGNILNSITLQHFLQRYPKICGMTATAQSAISEFQKFYNLKVVVIPPNKPCIRIDYKDVIFTTKSQKKDAIINEIIRVNRTERPILVGTASVEESAILANALQKHGVKCEVLNAKRDEYEAHIIAQAGKLKTVTISTNMAGRGTDIHLGGFDENENQKVVALGGLYVIGTNKHETQRIDNQLRGRSGRQGDPGASCFFISLEDDLFIKYRLHELFPASTLEDKPNGEINNNIIRNEIERLQRIIEGQNLEIKKTLFKYSSIIEKQRNVLFNKKKEIINTDSASQFIQLKSPKQFNKYKSLLEHKKTNNICRRIIAHSINKNWSQYLAEIAEIREGIHLLRLGGQEPFLEFQKLAVRIFADLLSKIDDEAIRLFNNIHITEKEIDEEEQKLKAPSSTWTYLINDNPFENLLYTQILGNIGISIGAALVGPIIALCQKIKNSKNN